jgi:anti-sigma regulatory factor (Ser/Thr protein kinase)
MVNRVHVQLKANDRSYFAILKKEVHALAVAGGFSTVKAGEIDIIVAEMVTNLVKHAGGGDLLVKLVEEDGIQGMELISIDNGIGMTDVTRMVADGISTKNTLGQGLGAMKRLADVFQVYSLKDWGTVILCRIFEEPLRKYRKQSKVEIRTAMIPKPGETECGDGFSALVTDDTIKLFMADGLGHGPEAAKAVMTAIESFTNCNEMLPSEIIRKINEDVKKTRGLVGTVAVYTTQEMKWRVCGIGNISTRINSHLGSKYYNAYNGIIGLNVPNKLMNQEVPFEEGQHVILCSDGIKSRWETYKYPAILRYDASLFAASLLKDFARYTDDMSVAVCKLNG